MLKPPALSVLALAAALPALPACLLDGGDDDASPITWRVPCGAHGEWDSGGIRDARYTYDQRKHLLTSESVDGDGALVSRTTRGWNVDDLIWSETETPTWRYRNDFVYEPAGRLVRWTRTDHTLDDGDDGFVFTYTYAGDELVGDLIDWNDPSRLDRRSTITGERSTRMTSIDCWIDGPDACDTWIWEQPDADPEHWTVGTGDLGSDGVIDERFAQTLDRNHLELTYAYDSLGASGQLEPIERATTTRETDGTALVWSLELFDGGAPIDTFTQTNLFECASARAATRPWSSSAAARTLPLDRDTAFAPRGRPLR